MKSVGVLAFHPAFTPPKSGGELRLYHLYREVARRGFSVELATPTYSDHAAARFSHAENFTEARFPKTRLVNRLHHFNDRFIRFAECSGLVCSLAAFRQRDLRAEVEHLAATADVLVQAYAFLTPLIPRRRRARQLLVYDAHNVETHLARTMFGRGPLGRLATARVSSLERRMLREADVVMACSEEDADVFASEFGVDRSRLVVVPNGVDVHEVQPASAAERAAARDLLELSSRPACFFIGSFHPPNVDAALLLIDKLAVPFPEVDFLLAGKVCQGLQGRSFPPNVRLLGLVSDELKKALLHGCNVALNPMLSGSGTNLKMLEYLAAGLPILSTPVGARGLAIEHCVHANVQEPEHLAGGLKDLLEDSTFRGNLAREARTHAEKRFAWESIGERVANLFHVRTGKRVLVLNDYAVMPAEQGGQVRVEAVAKRLAELGNNVSLLTLSTDKHRHFQAGPSLEEINVPRSFWHRRLDMRLNQLMGCGCDDASAALVTGILTREYTRQLRRELSRADAVLLSHPYMERVARRLPDSVRLFYDSHNSEYVLKEKLYKPTWLGRFLTWVVKRAEFRAARRSEAMFCVSGENRSEVALALPHLAGQAHVAPNGVDCRRCIVRGRDEKRELKRLAGLPEDRPLAVFLGSGHPPNAEAVRVLRDQVAGLAPDVIFGIIGSVAGWFHGQQLADNIVMLGPVETPVKDFLLQAADVALNPMLTGSGTSLKLFDYLAHGLPVISTPMGARGLSDEERAAILIAEPKDFAGALLALLASDERWREHSRAGRRLAEERYDWSVALRPFDAYFAPSSAR